MAALEALSVPHVVGLEDRPEDEARVRTLIAAMAPTAVPQNGIFFLPEKEFQKNAAQIAMGALNGRAVQASDPADENFGGLGQRTFVDGGYSVPAWSQTFLNAALLKHPDKLAKVLAHELGHYAAGGDESKTNAARDAYLKRAKAALKTWNSIQALPVTTKSAPDILSGK